jgi:hypothetical protein
VLSYLHFSVFRSSPTVIKLTFAIVNVVALDVD